MPAKDGTGPRGEYVACVDQKTGLRRPLRRYYPRLGYGLGRGRRRRGM